MMTRTETFFLGELWLIRPTTTWGPIGDAGGETAIAYHFRGSPALKDSIEALDLPHTEVDIFLLVGRSGGFDYRLQADDRIEVLPLGSEGPHGGDVHLSPPLLDSPIFILNVPLGKLARRLRMLGFDRRYRNGFTDPQATKLAQAEGLINQIRNREILKHARLRQGYLLGSDQVDEVA